MQVGGNLQKKLVAAIPHTMSREIEDLRNDMVNICKVQPALAVVEYTNPLTAAAAGLKAATATVAAIVTLVETDLLQAGRTELAANPRNLTFTTAGGTAADAPANVVITGLDAEGKAQTETVTLAQTATVANGVKAWSKVTKIVYPAADGTGATVSIGFGVVLGLPKKPLARAGLAAPIREIAIGAAVTTGTFDATNKTYTPAAAPNGTNDYCVFYEYDPTA